MWGIFGIINAPLLNGINVLKSSSNTSCKIIAKFYGFFFLIGFFKQISLSMIDV